MQHLPVLVVGIIIGSITVRSIFSHVSIIMGSFEEMLTVILLMITLILFTLEFSVSTANVLDPDTFRLVSRGSVDVNINLFPLLIQASEVEFPVIQVHVTVSPVHTDCLSHVTRVASAISIRQLT